MRLLVLATFLLPAVASAANLDPGLRSLQAGDYPRAEQELGAAVAKQPNDAIARFSYASALRGQGQNEAALNAYRDAFNSTKDAGVRSDALYGIALTRNAMNDPKETVDAWKNFINFAEEHKNNQGALTVARENLNVAEKAAERTP